MFTVYSTGIVFAMAPTVITCKYIFIVLSSTVRSHMREVTLGPLSLIWS